jgi:hypothetical protein
MPNGMMTFRCGGGDSTPACLRAAKSESRKKLAYLK